MSIWGTSPRSVPTAHRSEPDSPPTLSRLPNGTAGLGTMDHAFPSHRSTRGTDSVIPIVFDPTAHTSSEAKATDPTRLPWTVPGVEVSVHEPPSQCRAS